MESTKILTNIKPKYILESIKSNYILQIIFVYLSKKKSLDIIKYNKRIQKRKNISIKNYKEYPEIYSTIEIEIIPSIDKHGKFINFSQKDEAYYHIYFNNNTKEIKRNYIYENEKINLIKIIIDYQVESFEDLFYDCECIESINFTKFNRKNINNMSGMFYNCLSLKALNFSKFNTDMVTDFRYMFYGCKSLTQLNLSKFNTDNVTDMYYMFYECSSLIELILFNISNKEINMYRMFYGCPEQLQLKIKNQYKNIKEEAFWVINFNNY